ncbi:hypothetical protein NTE_00248 [Candidatus Nitrososphaera evergladensis SR1]|uniref:Uncharacterized protein n=1 Tax=Candidatus Nitrososphaera evergladensis SR1 TaxID=1459636 RepID=A0A075MMG8_9ARCH|nr:hypothetical protein [Candidatus Nitrososphaera evergladensis]AIF82330.1 hypothetical protein NTE_00248 [Candidatus Nitrososphaera evergladensis SR1]
MLAEHQARGIIKTGMSRAWNKDFEYDNFGTKRVVEKVAELLAGKVNGATLSVEEVEEKMKNGSVLMNAISAITNSKYGLKVADIVKKPELTEILIRERVEKIREERNAGEWKPDLEIEKVLDKIFKMIPVNR